MLLYTYIQNYVNNKISFIFLFIFLLIYFLNLLFLLFLFSNKYNITNNFLKLIKTTIFKKTDLYYLLLVFSSMLGIPPLSGFISKFILIFLISFKVNLFNLILVYIFVIFNVFFYLQILKLVNKAEFSYFDIIKNKKKHPNNFKNNKFTKNYIMLVLALFLLLLIFFIKDIILISHFLLF